MQPFVRMLVLSFAVALSMNPCIAVAQQTVKISQDFRKIPLGKLWEIAPDPDSSLTIDEVSSPGPKQPLFEQSIKDTPNFGFTQTSYWLRIILANKTHIEKKLVIEAAYPLLDQIDLYEQTQRPRDSNPTHAWTHRNAGDIKPFDDREFNYRSAAFNILLKPGEHLLCYIRVHSNSSMQLPFFLWSLKSFNSAVMNDQLGYGILFGCLLIMFLYHIFLYLTAKDKNYLYYVTYTLGALFFMASLNGHMFQYFLPNSPVWAGRTIPIFMAFWTIAAVWFSKGFLNTKHHTGKIDIALKIVVIAYVFIFIGSFFGATQMFTRISTILTAATGVATTAAGFIRWQQGFPPARYFFIAWLFFCTGVVMYALKSLGIIPSNLLTNIGLDVGTTMGVILMSMALGDRISTLRQEREQARSKHSHAESLKTASVASIKSLASDVSDVSKIMTEIISDLTVSTTEVADAVAETHATVEEIEQTAKSVESSAVHITEASDRSSSETTRGKKAIDETTNIILQIKDESHEISSLSQNMVAHLEEMDLIINLVKAIADQSKILAINASIEAAKSGQYGRGFAVIAREIKNLAQQSKGATAQVTTLLTAVRKSIEDIVKTSESGKQKTSQGVNMIAHSGLVVNDIAKAMNEQSKMANTISWNIQQQTKGLGHIVLAVD